MALHTSDSLRILWVCLRLRLLLLVMHWLLSVHYRDRLCHKLRDLSSRLLLLSCLHSLRLSLHLLVLEYIGVRNVEVRTRMTLALITDERWLLRRHWLDHHRLLLWLLCLVLNDDCILEAHVDRLMHGLLNHLLLLLFHSIQVLSANFPTAGFIYLTFIDALVVHEHVCRLFTTAHSLYAVVL